MLDPATSASFAAWVRSQMAPAPSAIVPAPSAGAWAGSVPPAPTPMALGATAASGAALRPFGRTAIATGVAAPALAAELAPVEGTSADATMRSGILDNEDLTSVNDSDEETVESIQARLWEEALAESPNAPTKAARLSKSGPLSQASGRRSSRLGSQETEGRRHGGSRSPSAASRTAAARQSSAGGARDAAAELGGATPPEQVPVDARIPPFPLPLPPQAEQ